VSSGLPTDDVEIPTRLISSTAQAQGQVQRMLLTDVVIRECAAFFEILACEEQALVFWANAFFAPDLRLDALDRVRELDVQSYRLTG